jgi:hypothetical protein
MYILITAASSSSAHKLKSQLNAENIILGDYRDLPTIMLANLAMIKLPNPSSLSYAHEMLTLCLDKQIDAIYPLEENEQLCLQQAAQLFIEFGITLNSGYEL